MNNPLKNLQKEALLLKLSSTEKAALHANLMRVIEADTARTPARIASPYFFFTPQLMGSFAAILLVLIGGTTYAAQGSVPGDALYAVKTKVTEPIQGALAFSAEDKIKFHGEIAQVRLEEAEVLASQNRLDTQATEVLESSIDTHLNERAALAAALEEKKPGATVSLSSHFESSITAHSDVLTQLGEGSASSSTKQNSNTIAAKVRVAYAGNSRNSVNAMAFSAKASTSDIAQPPTAPTPMAMSVSLENDMVEATATLMATGAPVAQSKQANEATARKEAAPSNNSSQEERKARSLEKRATSTLEELTRSAQKLAGKVDAETTAKVDARLSRITSLVAEGQAAITAGEYELAREHFDEALDRSTTLSTFIGAQVRFDQGILKQLLGNDSRWGND